MGGLTDQTQPTTTTPSPSATTSRPTRYDVGPDSEVLKKENDQVHFNFEPTS